jgi:hypothetical protein
VTAMTAAQTRTEPAYTRRAIATIDAAAAEHSFSEWLAYVVSEVVARRGWDAVEGRQGSWEASHVEALIHRTLGDVPL